jgi:hypothetical protein
MFRIFKKKSDTIETPIDKSNKNNSLNDYLTAKKDIKYLEKEYDGYILKSLECDLDEYKKFVDSNYPVLGDKTTHWAISNIKYDEIQIKKNEPGKQSWDYDGISVNCKIRFGELNAQWELRSISVKVDRQTFELDEKMFSDIIFQYYIYWQLKEVQKERDAKTQSFQRMINLIGKDVKRDKLIDQILSGEKSTN